VSGSGMLELLRSAGGDVLDIPFWEACQAGRFLLHRCEVCQRSYWPASRCLAHGAAAMQWVEASGRGTLYTYTIMHHAYTAEMKRKVPYIVGVVKLGEGPFFHSQVIDCAISDVRVDMPLMVVMQAHDSGLTLPMFRPVR
jgi:uncharacterized OB-fold protein